MYEPKVKSHNYLLDIFKLITALFVIAVHVRGDGKLPFLISFFNYPFAVPLFFAISGFFSYKKFNNEDVEYFKRKIKRTFKLYLICSICYTLFYFTMNLIQHEFKEYFMNGLSFKNIAKFILLNKPIFAGGHLWFILSLLYVYIYVYIFLRLGDKKNKFTINLVFSILLIVAATIIDIGFDFNYVLTRNWLFYGLPCFFAGVFAGKYQEKIKEINLIYYLLILVSALSCKNLIEYYSLCYRHDISVFIIIFSVTLLCISIKYDTLIKENRIIKYFGDLSMYIYIVHWGVLKVINYSADNYIDFLSNITIKLFVAAFISFSFSCLYMIIKQKRLKSS